MTTNHKNTDNIRKKLLEQRYDARIARKIVLITASTILILLILFIGGGFLYIHSALNPVDSKSKVVKTVDIPIGSSVQEIGERLQAKGIIKNSTVFKYYVKFKNESGFMAGDYELSPSMSVPEILGRLKGGKVFQKAAVVIAIPEGEQLKEIAHLMAKATKQKDDAVFSQLNDKAFVAKLMAKYPDILTNDILNSNVMYPLEGYLYPATYSFNKPNPSVEEMVTAMLDKTRTVFAGYSQELRDQHLSMQQWLTMASLVEQEATANADRKKIASVFYNRLKTGMPLQTDPTVLYAEGKHKAVVLYQDLEVNSPYNTYKNTGLPPGPISNAGKTSLDAALHPGQTDYYYFLATPDGNVIFSKTLEEHNQAKAKYITNK